MQSSRQSIKGWRRNSVLVLFEWTEVLTTTSANIYRIVWTDYWDYWLLFSQHHLRMDYCIISSKAKSSVIGCFKTKLLRKRKVKQNNSFGSISSFLNTRGRLNIFRLMQVTYLHAYQQVWLTQSPLSETCRRILRTVPVELGELLLCWSGLFKLIRPGSSSWVFAGTSSPQ